MRRRVLGEMFQRGIDDPERVFSIPELAGWASVEQAAVERAVRGLIYLGLAEEPDTAYDPYGCVKLTRQGYLEGERMEEPFHQRWPSEHPLLLAFFSSVVTGIVVAIAGPLFRKLLGLE